MIINATPHEFTLVSDEGEVIRRIPTSGIVVRLDQKDVLVDNVDGIEIYSTTFGEVTGLPDEVEGTYYIVSAIVATALKGQRSDLLISGKTYRNDKGQIVGARALARV